MFCTCSDLEANDISIIGARSDPKPCLQLLIMGGVSVDLAKQSYTYALNLVCSNTTIVRHSTGYGGIDAGTEWCVGKALSVHDCISPPCKSLVLS